MNTYIILADIGRTVVISTLFFFVVAVALAVSILHHNNNKMKAAKALEAKEEIKSVFLSYAGIVILTFSLLTSMYFADSIVSIIIIGILYLVSFYFMFKKSP